MRTVIYVDILLVTNFLLNLLLLLTTAAFLKMKINIFRFLVGASVGAIYALIILAPSIGIILSLLSKLSVSICISCISFGGKTLRSITRQTAIYFIMSCVFAGLMLLIKTVFSSSYILVNNSASYFAVGFRQIVLIAAVSYLCLYIIIKKMHVHKTGRECYTVTLFCNEKQVTLNGFVDSGNGLYEPITQNPVSVVDYRSVCNLFPATICNFMKGELSQIHDEQDESWRKRLYVIPANFVVGEALLPAFRVDRMLLSNGERSCMLNGSLLAVAKHEFNFENASVLLHPAVVQQECNQELKNYETIAQ